MTAIEASHAPPATTSRAPLVVALLAGVVVWSVASFGPYGWFTDELYFLACARRPALGYVDHPPLATLLLALIRLVFADHMALIRLVPAGVYAASILQVGRLARDLEGGAFAQTLAAVGFATAPAVLVIASFYSMNPLELLWSILLARVALALARGAPPRTWLWFGAVTGLALLTKHSALLPAGLFAAAALVSPARAHLATRWPYLGAALALAIAVPNLGWLVLHDGITFEFYRISVPLKNIQQTPLGALIGQAMFVGPLAFLLAVLGAVTLASRPGLRGVALAFAVALAIMMASGISRADRILAIYPVLFAAGACGLERLTRQRRTLRVLACASLAIAAAPPLPLVLPMLPPEQVLRYSRALGVTPKLEAAKRGAMPQWLGDRRGWTDVVAATAAAYRSLSPADQRVAEVFAGDYGSAGAIELLGPAAGIPARVTSTHNAFWMWGPPTAPVLVAVGFDEAYWEALYADVHRAGTVRCTGCLVDGMAVWVVRGDAPGLAARWSPLRKLE